MRREVVINIPMFIGIILIVAVSTTILVYAVNFTMETIRSDNERMNEEFENIEGYFDKQMIEDD